MALYGPVTKNRNSIPRIIINGEYQNKGLGSALMALLEANYPLARSFSLDTPHLNIRNHHFYEKLGYKVAGDEFIEVTIPHFVMEKKL